MFRLEGQHNHRKPLRILRDRTHLLKGHNINSSCNHTFIFLMNLMIYVPGSYIFHFNINAYPYLYKINPRVTSCIMMQYRISFFVFQFLWILLASDFFSETFRYIDHSSNMYSKHSYPFWWPLSCFAVVSWSQIVSVWKAGILSSWDLIGQ